MPYLKLRNARSGHTFEFERDQVRVGRAPDLELTLEGEGSEVVSGNHARLAFRDGAWVLEDTGSTNGTFLDEKRLSAGQSVPIATGSVVGFGSAGPRFHVEAAAEQKLVPTLVEGQPAVSPDDKTVQMEGLPEAPPPPGPTPPAAKDTGGRKIKVTLREDRTGDVVTGEGARLRIGRGRECELRPVQEGDTTVSRVHAEIVLKPDGAVVIRDAQSRNGTFINGNQLKAEHEIREGDYIVLGNEGPHLVVTKLEGGRQLEPQQAAAAAPTRQQDEGEAGEAAPPKPRRSFGGKGRTVFVRELVEETSKKSSATLRKAVWSFTFLLVAGVGGVYWYVEQQAQETEAALEQQRQALAAQQAIADSMQTAATAEYDRLREDLDQARSSSAPAAVVDSLRQALVRAQARTDALEQSLRRARTELDRQLAQADSQRQIRESELDRLRSEMTAAIQGSVSSELLDSLRQAVSNAEQQLSGIEGRMRAVRGVDLASVAQTNQGAVGLVSAYIGGRIFDGSGFAITASGYFLTNRHVVLQRGRRADSVFVTMADQRRMIRADIINVAQPTGPDLAVLQIRNYNGPHVPRIDWAATKARQGEPAALIGFPAGLAAALDRTQTIRTSMAGGIFSQVTPDEIRFDGFTVGGSSGSPILNASGEVVAVHRAGLAEAAGLAFAVPVRLAIPLLPAAALREAGLR
ncbi:MAG: FHA domain-containing protein [Gemmatimonadetes bacterium]|nr:FHA domain-containing protein [Gemmatimonadota bacterium]